MKMKIKWHEECLTNWKRTIEEEKVHLSSMQAHLLESVSRCKFLEHQIEEAKRKGKDGFNSEKFCKEGKNAPQN